MPAINDRSADDPFIVLAALHSGQDCYIVTNDLLRNASHDMTVDARRLDDTAFPEPPVQQSEEKQSANYGVHSPSRTPPSTVSQSAVAATAASTELQPHQKLLLKAGLSPNALETSSNLLMQLFDEWLLARCCRFLIYPFFSMRVCFLFT